MKDMDKYVEEKARELNNLILSLIDSRKTMKHDNGVKMVKDFIRTIVEECQVKVSQEFMEKWNIKFDGGHGYKTFWEALEAMLKEAGLKVENK